MKLYKNETDRPLQLREEIEGKTLPELLMVYKGTEHSIRYINDEK